MPVFRDRVEAGLALAGALARLRGSADAVVLAVPRGGVAVGAAIARELGLPLGALLVKKIGHPLSPEVAIGSVGLTGAELDPVAAGGVSSAWVRGEVLRLRAALRRQAQAYGVESPLPITGRAVILADDGAATGHTLLAAAGLVRAQRPRELVIAVPVAPPEVAERLARACGELVVLEKPEEFNAVGEFYENFGAVEDSEVVRLLGEAALK